MKGHGEPRKSRRLWRFFRTVWDMRSLVLEGTEDVLRIAAIARIVNPLFIVVLFISFVYSLLLIAAATVTILLTMLF